MYKKNIRILLIVFGCDLIFSAMSHRTLGMSAEDETSPVRRNHSLEQRYYDSVVIPRIRAATYEAEEENARNQCAREFITGPGGIIFASSCAVIGGIGGLLWGLNHGSTDGNLGVAGLILTLFGGYFCTSVCYMWWYNKLCN
jgi:hypothetical protein